MSVTFFGLILSVSALVYACVMWFRVRKESIEFEILLDESRAEIKKLRTKVQEEERKRLSRDLHDEFGQSLAVMKIELAQMKSKMPEKACPVRHRVDELSATVDWLVVEMRRLTSDLTPLSFQDKGLRNAIERLVSDVQRKTGIQIHVVKDEIRKDISEEAKVALYRIMQEAITNAVKHSESDKIDVSLTAQEKSVELRVRDYGTKVVDQYSSKSGSLGIGGMRDRALSVGGEFKIQNLTPERGTLVTVAIPC